VVTKKPKYRVTLHPLVGVEDLPLLPEFLRDDLAKYQFVLAIDQVQTQGVPSHDLRGDLRHYRALEIDYNGVCYRLVYRVYESPTPKRVQVISFAEHDLAYEKAKERV
jgi:mRNA interferase RelE/StbE